MAISDNLRKLRQDRGVTQEQLAEVLGLTQQAYGKYELGYAQPNATQAVAIAKRLGVTVEQLVGGGDDETEADRDGDSPGTI